MTKKERLVKLLKKSTKWWNFYRKITNLCNANLCNANLRSASLCGADLSGASLCNANLCGADLRYADLDFSQWGLSCKTLKTKIDSQIISQLLYHACMPAQNNKLELNADIEKLFKLKTFQKVVNQFHRVEECGEFKEIKVKEKK